MQPQSPDSSYQLVIEPKNNLFDLNLPELWDYRELLYFLVWRDIKIKYKQSILGIGWAIFQPVMSMVIYTFIFGHVAKISSGDVPYPAFALCGIVLWTYFSQSITGGTQSLIQNRHLITKVYFPRLMIPLASVGRGLFDLVISCIILLMILVYYRQFSGLQIMFAPVFILLTFMCAFSISTWTSAISVKYRDLPYTIPFLVQLLFWVTPVAYGSGSFSSHHLIYLSWNPMYSVIEGFRWSLLGTEFVSPRSFYISLTMIFVVFTGSIIFFRSAEKTFSDII